MAPPPPLIVRNNPVAYKQQVAIILLFAALFAIIPLFFGDPQSGVGPRGPAIVTIALVLWALYAIRQGRNQDPQIIVNPNGLYVRSWHLGVVPWDDIVLVAQGGAMRQPLATRVFRRRLGGYLTVRFRQYPRFQTAAPVPISWVQWLMHHLDNSDPIIAVARFDASITQVMAAIDAQITYRKEARA